MTSNPPSSSPRLTTLETARRRAILEDLRVGQSTADSIAPRVSLPPETVHRICKDLLSAGHVEKLIIAGFLEVYRITPAGLQSIE